MTNHTFTFHLIPNAHLDPVWLWDWREGLNEGLVTCRTILDLMDEDPELTFIRGESAIYQHIEKNDPATFARIKKYVKSGRWDVVGGTVIQPDTNLPATETFARHFAHGLQFFQSRFGKRVRVAWAADSFGHAEGLPEILAAAGIEGFAFSRPAKNIVPIDKPAFWWEGPGGSRVLAYRPETGWYGCERHEIPTRFDGYLESAGKQDLQNVGCFFGLGNHGGGPTRRIIAEIRTWAAKHPEVRVEFSGLHRLFEALNREAAQKSLPVHRGELNYVLRGCYASVAKFKFLYRRTEAILQRAESALTCGTGFQPVRGARHGLKTRATGEQLTEAWDSLLFNSFHDILPGSSIERAFDDQLAWLGGAYHLAQSVEFDALNILASKIDTRVQTPKGDMPSGVAMLVWNPHPFEYRGPIELEACLDYRPIWKYHKNVDAMPVRVLGANRKPIPFQVIDTEHHSMVELAWRKRVIIDATIPAMGWSVFEMAYREDSSTLEIDSLVNARDNEIDNGMYRVRAEVGQKSIEIFHNGKSIFDGGLSAITVEDPWGSWGGMGEEPDSIDLSKVRHEWKITQTQVLESGPLRAKMWVRMQGGNSRMDLTISLTHGRESVDVAARVFWDERSARLKLVMPAGERAEFDVPGATITRGPVGEVSGGRWVRVANGNRTIGFASDALYGFDCKDGALRATVVRASRYADDVNTPPDKEIWRPAVDAGELRFNFLISTGDENLPQLAKQLEQPLVTMLVPPHGPKDEGKLGRSGSLASIEPKSLNLLALKPAMDGKGIILRLQETAGKATTPRFTWLGQRVALSKIPAKRIMTWRVRKSGARWIAKPVDVAETDNRRLSS